jgi:hypothetical protein
VGRPRRTICRKCGGHIDEVGPLSARGLCELDSIAGVTNAIEQVSRRQGPLYDKYVDGMQAYAARLAAGGPRET